MVMASLSTDGELKNQDGELLPWNNIEKWWSSSIYIRTSKETIKEKK